MRRFLGVIVVQVLSTSGSRLLTRCVCVIMTLDFKVVRRLL